MDASACGMQTSSRSRASCRSAHRWRSADARAVRRRRSVLVVGTRRARSRAEVVRHAGRAVVRVPARAEGRASPVDSPVGRKAERNRAVASAHGPRGRTGSRRVDALGRVAGSSRAWVFRTSPGRADSASGRGLRHPGRRRRRSAHPSSSAAPRSDPKADSATPAGPLPARAGQQEADAARAPSAGLGRRAGSGARASTLRRPTVGVPSVSLHRGRGQPRRKGQPPRKIEEFLASRRRRTTRTIRRRRMVRARQRTSRRRLGTVDAAVGLLGSPTAHRQRPFVVPADDRGVHSRRAIRRDLIGRDDRALGGSEDE